MSERDYMRASWGGPRPGFFTTDRGTKTLLIVLAGIHLAMTMLHATAPAVYDSVAKLLWLHPDDVLSRFEVWQLFTYALFHSPGFWHLLMNALMIWFLGRMVEQRLGPRRFHLFCLGAAVTASLAYLLLEVGVFRRNFPMLGASGVAMGLTVLAALWYPRVTILFMFVFPMPLWLLGVILVFLDFIQLMGMSGGVANAAHLGGALYGLAYWKWGGRFGQAFGAIDRYVDRQRAKKEMRTRAREAEMRLEIDRILDKVNREGMGALSDSERKFLKEASGKLRS